MTLPTLTATKLRGHPLQVHFPALKWATLPLLASTPTGPTTVRLTWLPTLLEEQPLHALDKSWIPQIPGNNFSGKSGIQLLQLTCLTCLQNCGFRVTLWLDSHSDILFKLFVYISYCNVLPQPVTLCSYRLNPNLRHRFDISHSNQLGLVGGNKNSQLSFTSFWPDESFAIISSP